MTIKAIIEGAIKKDEPLEPATGTAGTQERISTSHVTYSGAITITTTNTQDTEAPALVHLIMDLGLSTGEGVAPTTPVPAPLAAKGVTEGMWQQTYDGALLVRVVGLIQQAQTAARKSPKRLLAFVILSSVMLSAWIYVVIPLLLRPLLDAVAIFSVLYVLLAVMGLVVTCLIYWVAVFVPDSKLDDSVGKIHKMKARWIEFVKEQDGHYKGLGIDATASTNEDFMHYYKQLGINPTPQLKRHLVGIKFAISGGCSEGHGEGLPGLSDAVSCTHVEKLCTV
ncbi:expressed unknown protein [Seminavis robusta]|uniref:Uncharacterized protein n=1 Tax=Seminavis robusta TaxID=568900 RepID=A0A9N8DHF3_9STRA|nr:expressed unknown protein [Seminavis robusta]|eukprot:Sro90_g047210.1 n/a (281) ;mRNA; r:8762-9604